MSAPEWQFKQIDAQSLLQETIYFDIATNLTGAAYQFIYQSLEDAEPTVRTALLVSASPSTGAATSAVVKRVLTTADVSEVGYFVYEWKITLADQTVLVKPTQPTQDTSTDYANRTNRVFEIIPSLGVETVESDDGESTLITSSLMIVDDLTELAALPFSVNYHLAIVQSDLNGMSGQFWWDEEIETADADPNNVVPLTDPLGGGWARSGY